MYCKQLVTMQQNNEHARKKTQSGVYVLPIICFTRLQIHAIYFKKQYLTVISACGPRIIRVQAESRFKIIGIYFCDATPSCVT